jgi:hypothetical protein
MIRACAGISASYKRYSLHRIFIALYASANAIRIPGELWPQSDYQVFLPDITICLVIRELIDPYYGRDKEAMGKPKSKGRPAVRTSQERCP